VRLIAVKVEKMGGVHLRSQDSEHVI